MEEKTQIERELDLLNATLRFNAGINGKKNLLDYNLTYSFFNTEGINEAADPDPNADKDAFQQQNLSASFGLMKFVQ